MKRLLIALLLVPYVALATGGFPDPVTIYGPVTVTGTVTITPTSFGRTWTLLNSTDSVTSFQGTTPWVDNLAQVAGSPFSLGVNTAVHSLPVVIASDQAPIPVTGMVTDTNPSIGPIASPIPSFATLTGFKDSSGNLSTVSLTASNAFPVDGSAVTQPVSAVSLPLPTGASTNSELITINTTLGSPFQAGGSIGNTAFGISGTLPPFASTPTVNASQSGSWSVTANAGTNLNTSALALESGGHLSSIDGKITTTANGIKTDGSAVTQPISAAALPLPSGASTSANQATIISSLSTINTTLGSPFQAGGSIGNTAFGSSQVGSWTTGRTWTLLNTTDSVNVGNFPATQAVTQSTSPWVVSGTVTANAGTNLNTSALNLETTQSSFKTANHSDLASINTTLGSPAQEHVTAASPNSSRLSDGTSFYVGFKSGDSIGNTAFIANAGTNLNTSALQLDTTGAKLNNAQGSATSGQTGPLMQGSVTTGAPAYTTAQTSPLSLTTAGNLRVDGSSVIQPISATALPLPSGAATNSALVTINTTLGSPFQAGGSIGNTTFAATQSGTWNINNVSGTVSLPTGASTSANQTTINTSINQVDTDLLAFKSSNHTDLTASQPRKLQDGSGNSVTSQASGGQRALDIGIDVAGSQVDPRSIRALTSSDVVTANQGGAWNITNVSGTVSLPTGASTSANQTNGTQKTQVVDGSGNVAPSADVASRKSFTAITDGTNTAAVKAASTAASATDPAMVVAISPNGSGQQLMAASQPVVLSSNQSGINTFLDKSGSGSIGALNAAVTVTTNGSSTVFFNATGTFTATLSIEGTADGTNWVNTAGIIPIGQVTGTIGSDSMIGVPSGGFQQVRIRASAYTSGTASITWNLGAGNYLSQVYNLNAANLLATTTQGAANTAANAWPTKVTDGTNVAAVKAASTGAAITDPAMVITDRPDNVGTPTQTSVSCATTTTTLLAASTATMFLMIRNPTTSANTVWINVAGASATTAAPSIDLAPGSEADFFAEGSGFLPTAQINCIASTGATTVTVMYK